MDTGLGAGTLSLLGQLHLLFAGIFQPRALAERVLHLVQGPFLQVVVAPFLEVAVVGLFLEVVVASFLHVLVEGGLYTGLSLNWMLQTLVDWRRGLPVDTGYTVGGVLGALFLGMFLFIHVVAIHLLLFTRVDELGRRGALVGGVLV